jgi:phage-related minor tail protein
MASVGYATLDIIPSLKGMKGKLEQGMAAPALAAGKTSGGHFTAGLAGSVSKRGHGIGRSLASHLGVGFAALGVGSIVKSSVQLEASFSKTLSQIAVATGAPKSAMKGLHDTAMKMGADTVFSANEAADAMLELGKSGISTKDIMGGGVKGTLTLAAAGSLDLASAATIASNAMNTFGLHGKDMGTIAAALAGGANASTASVESLGQALSQVGPGARNAGLSLQETVGTLAAFDQAGIKGSDAGTSLKTMLTRLVPQTKGKVAMDLTWGCRSSTPRATSTTSRRSPRSCRTSWVVCRRSSGRRRWRRSSVRTRPAPRRS